MATAVFQGASADWDDTDNWTGGGGTGGVPANSDTVIIGQSAQSLTTNLTTGLTGITLRIGPGYTGQIGAAANFLDIDCGTVDLDSGGDLYLTGTWTTCNVQGMQASATAVVIAGNASSDIGTLRILGGSGTVTVETNAVLDDVIVASSPAATLAIEASVSSLDTITMDSGRVTCASNLAGITTVRGGVLLVTGTATMATLVLEARGVVRHRSSGTITTLTGYSGLFDGRENNSGTVTITNCELFDATIDVRSGLKNYAFTGGVVVRGDGLLRAHPGSTLTFA